MSDMVKKPHKKFIVLDENNNELEVVLYYLCKKVPRQLGHELVRYDHTWETSDGRPVRPTGDETYEIIETGQCLRELREGD